VQKKCRELLEKWRGHLYLAESDWQMRADVHTGHSMRGEYRGPRRQLHHDSAKPSWVMVCPMKMRLCFSLYALKGPTTVFKYRSIFSTVRQSNAGNAISEPQAILESRTDISTGR
jgi:hypothetical protein